LETPLLPTAKSLALLCAWHALSSESKFSRILSPSAIGVFPKLTGEFTSLEEPSDDSNITFVLGLLADESGFVKSERRDEPDGPMKMLKLPIVNSISWLLSSSELLLAKSEKAVEFMIPMPKLPTVGAN
jgi:hypothetical protein